MRIAIAISAVCILAWLALTLSGAAILTTEQPHTDKSARYWEEKDFLKCTYFAGTRTIDVYYPHSNIGTSDLGKKKRAACPMWFIP